MKEKLIGNNIVLRLEIGEDIIGCVKEVCNRHDVSAAYINGIGALKKAVVGVFNMQTKEYKANEMADLMEHN